MAVVVIKWSPTTAHQVLCMSMNGETWSALGAFVPSGSKRKATLAPQGVLVTSAMHFSTGPEAEWQ